VKAWQELLAQMHEILEEDEENKNYGVRRMQIALEQRGIKRSLSTVKRVMARGNLLHEDRRSPDGLTKADKKALRPQNIIKQDFRAQEPLRKLLTDITQILCKDGKLYVSPLLDCYAEASIQAAQKDARTAACGAEYEWSWEMLG